MGLVLRRQPNPCSMKPIPRITQSTSNTQVRRLVKQYLHSILKPDIRVFVSKQSSVSNPGHGIRKCFQVCIWHKKHSRNQGLWVNAFSKKDILPYTIEAISDYNLNIFLQIKQPQTKLPSVQEVSDRSAPESYFVKPKNRYSKFLKSNQ